MQLFLTGTFDTHINFIYKKASADDIKTVSVWHRDESVRRWIHVDDWTGYYGAVSKDPCYFLVAVYRDGTMIAHSAAEKFDGELALSLIVAPELHGQGIGTAVLTGMIKNYRQLFGDIHTFTAGIYPGNNASRRCFEKAGFVYACSGGDGEMVYKFRIKGTS